MATERCGGLASQWTTVNGWRVYARIATDGPPREALPVVLVHGLSVSSRYPLPTAASHGLDDEGTSRRQLTPAPPRRDVGEAYTRFRGLRPP
jgi:hypothetical protein